MRRMAVVMIAGLAGCHAPPDGAGNAAGVSAQASADPERAALARQANAPDFSAVDALASGQASPGAPAPAAGEAHASLARVASVPDPAAAMRSALAEAAAGRDGWRELPLAPDLLVAKRRDEARAEGTAHLDYDYLTGTQEAEVTLRDLTVAKRQIAPDRMEVTANFTIDGGGARRLVSEWAGNADGGWQLADMRDGQSALMDILEKGE